VKYAILIRKSDLPLIAALNGGIEVDIEKRNTYLIVDIDGTNEIVTETELFRDHEINSYGPTLLKLRK